MYNGTDKRLFWLKRDNGGTNKDTPHARDDINPVDEPVAARSVSNKKTSR